jgi:fused signal recognition particle receptor
MLGLFKKSQGQSAESAPVSLFSRLKEGLKNTGAKLSGLLSGRRIDEALFEELESALLAADAGVEATNYLIEQLRAYRSGKRQNEIMSIMAKPLSNGDIEDLAAWYSSIKVEVK